MSIPVKKTLDEVREMIFQHINDVQDEYVAKGWLPRRLNLNKGVVRGLIEIWSWGLHKLYVFLESLFYQIFPSSSSETYLDEHAVQVAVARRESTKAAGVVVFNGPAAGNVKIPAGRILKTDPDGEGNTYRFVTTEDAILSDGYTSVSVPVESEEYGRKANVGPGQITNIATHIPGIESVSNDSNWLTSEGADEENDSSLQTRYALAWSGISGVNSAAYKKWALDITAVIAVKILDRHPRGQGTIDVIIRGAAGIPTDSLLAEVRAEIEKKRPQNDNVLVKGPTPVSVRISGTLYLSAGDSNNLLQAENRIRALFEDPTDYPGVTPLQIGQDLTLDRLTSEAMAGAGYHLCQRIDWDQPMTDVSVPDDGLAILESLTLSVQWVYV